MCKYFYLIFIVILFGKQTKQDDDFYTAAVVEYNFGTAANSVDSYINIIQSLDESVDIVVFPEGTLSGTTQVPDGSDTSIVVCNNTDFPEFFQRISCAAIERGVYIVVNLNEQEPCTEESQAAAGDDRPCSSTGYNTYNTNAVFDRNGVVVSRYRKFNLFGEYGRNKTLTPDISTFTTDFNVTFGMFTCFDLLFETPALALVRLGIRNIIFPTMWFSEMPFLTALQAQQMFAHTNNVNFLSAGANRPSIGSGGTAIFQGVNGPVVYDIVEEGGTKAYVAKVGKTPEITEDSNSIDATSSYEQNNDTSAELLDNFYLKRDNIDVYTSTPLDVTSGQVVEELCHEADDGNTLCCKFNITTTHSLPDNSSDYYSYRLLVYSGVRSYDGVWNGGIENCAVVACTGDTLATCGLRFSNYSNVVWPTAFEHIEIKANFTDIHTRIQYPNSLLSTIRPVYPNSTEWTTVEYEDEEIVERTFVLHAPQNRLITFGIQGRDFARDSDPAASASYKLRFNLYSLVILCIAGKFVQLS